MTDHSRLRVVFPVGSFYPAQTGGPDNTVYWLTKALRGAGLDPVISSTDRGLSPEVPRDEWLDTAYGRVIYRRNPIHYLPTRTVASAVSQLGGADALHLTMVTYPAAWLTALVNGRRGRLPIMWSVRGDLDPPMLERSARKKAAVLTVVRAIERRQRVTFHTTCAAETDYVRRAIGPGVRTLEIPNYMELPERVHVARERKFVFLGRIDPKKGIENLLEAVSRTGGFRQNGFRLAIAGDADHAYGRGLRALTGRLGLGDVVEFVGQVEGERKERFLASAHCLVMPSHTENFGIVVSEALAQGTPAIASTGTPWSILPAEGCGWWRPNDPDAVSACLTEAMALTPERFAGMSARAATVAREHFDIHARVSEWTDAYKRLVHG